MGEIHVHEFMSLDGVVNAPTWTFDYGFDPQMGERSQERASIRAETSRVGSTMVASRGVVSTTRSICTLSPSPSPSPSSSSAPRFFFGLALARSGDRDCALAQLL